MLKTSIALYNVSIVKYYKYYKYYNKCCEDVVIFSSADLQ
jgi:hypothetical protein